MTTTTTVSNLGSAQGANPLKGLLAYGQSAWMDYIRRDLLLDGDLQKVHSRGRPARHDFQSRHFRESHRRQHGLRRIRPRRKPPISTPKASTNKSPSATFRTPATFLRRCMTESKRRDGYVSLEVSPAPRDTTPTKPARKRAVCGKTVGRENLMIKIPAHARGHPGHSAGSRAKASTSMSRCSSRNVYEQVADAYPCRARSSRRERAGTSATSPAWPASSSAASTRWSTRSSTNKLKTATDASKRALLTSLQGKVAIANAKLTYQSTSRFSPAPRWQGSGSQRRADAARAVGQHQHQESQVSRRALRRRTDRPDTVNTIPPATFDAFRDHGKLRDSLDEDVDGAQQTMDDARQGRHLHEGSHRQADRRRRETLRGSFRQAARRRRSKSAGVHA